MSLTVPEVKKLRIRACTPVIVGYCRVSTSRQATYGVSLETQTTAISRFAEYRNYTVRKFVVDAGISGRSYENRPKLQDLIAELQPNEYLVVQSLSRLARNLKETMEIYNLIRSKRAYFISLDFDINTNTAIGQLIFHILAALQEFESNQTSERVTENMITLKAQGRQRGRPKYGWKSLHDGKDHVPDPEEQNGLATMRQKKRDSPNIGFSQMAKFLNDLKVPCRKAKKWWPSRVREIMQENGMLNVGEIELDIDQTEAEDLTEQVDYAIEEATFSVKQVTNAEVSLIDEKANSEPQSTPIRAPSAPPHIPNPGYNYSTPQITRSQGFISASPYPV